MRTLAALLTLALAMPTLAKIVTKDIEYKHGDTVLRGFLAYDDAVAGKRPGVLVVHEWWGLTDYPKARASQLAELGYVAFALDMFGKGVTTSDAQEAGKLAGALYKDPKLLRARAAAGLKVLTDQPNVDPGKVAAIGYCFGGKTSLELARSGADLTAVVSFHGGLGTDMPASSGGGALKPRILICNGADDTFISAEEKAAFYKEMKDTKADFVFIEYAGAAHAFTNPDADKFNIPGVKYNQKADRRSWQHMQDLLNEAFGAAKK